MNVYEFKMKTITGEEKNLEDYRGKGLLIVNVASKCGLTSQYEGLEKLYKEYKIEGLEVLGFPANEFGSQEPGTDSEIRDFCQSSFGVQFPMFSKIVVKGPGQHPLYKYLTETKKEAQVKVDGKLMNILKEKNLLTGNAHDIKWNFEKFLVNRKGEVVQRYAPDVDPFDPMILNDIKIVLSGN